MGRFLCFAALLLPFSVACATATHPFQDTGEELWARRAFADINVRVENEHYLAVRVVAVWDDMDYFLGEVAPGSTETFRLPGSLVASHGGPRLLADPRGSTQEVLTAPVACQKARWIEWRLKRNLQPSRPHVL